MMGMSNLGNKGVFPGIIVLCISLFMLSGCAEQPVRHVAVGWQGGVNGGAIIRSSIYGLNWNDDDLNTAWNGSYGGKALNDVAADPDNGRFVAVGGLSALAAIGWVLYSDDMGETWIPGDTTQASGGQVGTQLYGIALGYPPGLPSFVAVGDSGTLIRSINGGEFWVAGSSNVSPNLRDVAWCNDRFIAVGEGGSMLYSANGGQTWGTLASGTTDDLLGIHCGNGVVIVTGAQGTMLRSTDGQIWQEVNSQTGEDMHAVAFGYNQDGGAVWEAVGSNGTVRFSEDNGITWVARLNASPTTNDLLGVVYAMGKFVAVGKNITLYTLDGRDWTIGTAIPGNFHFLRSIARP